MKNKFLSILLTLCFSHPTMSKSSSQIDIKYESLSAQEKQKIIWNKILESEYKSYPKLEEVGLFEVLKISSQKLSKKADTQSDFAPKRWKKYLHRRGAVATIEYKSIGNHQYTGVFKDTALGLLRLSLTYQPEPKGKPFAPGLALKIFRDGVPSSNVSALYTLSGQGQNYNFFANPLSNIVPAGDSSGEKVINWIFSRISNYPEKLSMESMSQYNGKGIKENRSKKPVQIFFVPNESLHFNEKRHDFRDDLVSIKEGTILYHVYAVTENENLQSYNNYQIEDIEEKVKKSILIGEIKSTSRFVVSKFGDTGIFFKHDIIKK